MLYTLLKGETNKFKSKPNAQVNTNIDFTH